METPRGISQLAEMMVDADLELAQRRTQVAVNGI